MIGVSECTYSRFDVFVGKVSLLTRLRVTVYRLIVTRTEYTWYSRKKSAATDYHRLVIGIAHMTLTRGLKFFSSIRLLASP